jgi:hypothetical protein
VSARVYDLLGRRLATLHEGQTSGTEALRWRSGAAGAYLLVVRGEHFTATRTFVVQ